jgi:hypothetical protein
MALRAVKFLTNPVSKYSSPLLRAAAQGPAAFEAAHAQLMNDPEYLKELNAVE